MAAVLRPTYHRRTERIDTLVHVLQQTYLDAEITLTGVEEPCMMG